MDKRDLHAAQHMLAHCARIERYLARCSNDLAQFMHDEPLQAFFTQICAEATTEI